MTHPILLILIHFVAFLIVIRLISFIKNTIWERRYYQALHEDMSWQLSKARENGIDFDTVYFDNTGNMRYKDSHQIVE